MSTPNSSCRSRTGASRERRIRRVVLAAAVLFGSGSRAASAPSVAEWSLLVYANADCNLEAAILEQVQALIDVGGTSDVRVLALVDRHESGDRGRPGRYSAEPIGGLDDWTGAKRLEIVRDKLVDHDPGPAVEADMASPATLAGFVRWAHRAAPARRTALILKDHGAGFRGLLKDDAPTGVGSDTPSWMSLEELRQGLETGLDGDRLDLLVADACSMACVEFLSVAAPFAAKAVAAESLTRVGSLHLGDVLRDLEADPFMDGTALGRVLLARYGDRRTDPWGSAGDVVDRRDGLLALFDLDAWGGVQQGLDEVGSALVGSIRARGDSADRLICWRRLAVSPILQYNCESDQYNCATYDLDELISSLRDGATPHLRRVLDRLERRLRRARLGVVRGPDFAGRGGVQVYVPRDGLLNDAVGLPASHWCDGWGAFVATHARREGVAAGSAIVSTPTISSRGGVPVVSARVLSSADAVGTATLVVQSTVDDTEQFRFPAAPDECGWMHTRIGLRGLRLRVGARPPRPLAVTSVRAVRGRDETYVVETPVLKSVPHEAPSAGLLKVLLAEIDGVWRTELLSVVDQDDGLPVAVDVDLLTSLAPMPAQLSFAKLESAAKVDAASSLRSADGRGVAVAIEVLPPIPPFVSDVEVFYEVVDVDGAIVKSAAVPLP